MMSRARLLLASIILASAALYLVGNGSIALWDRDEPRYAQTSRQMLQSSDWVVPHYLDLVRTAKPALIYWCQAASMEIFGDNALAARFPSALATAILLIVLSIVLWRYIGAERTVWTVFILASSGLVIAAAKMCLTDAVLLLWITIAQLCLYAIWRRHFTWPVVLVMSIAIGLAALTKGPVILGFQLMTLVALWVMSVIDRRFPPIAHDRAAIGGDLMRFDSHALAKTIVGFLLVLAIVLPWVLAVNHRASTFLKTAVGHDVWERMMTPLEQHTGPPGYYLISIWITFFPWSIFLPLAIGLAIRYRANPQTRFTLAAVVGPWVMLECVRTKLPHYFLPAFPPLAFLTADAIVRCLHAEHDDLKSRGFVLGIGIWSIIVAILASTPWLAMRFYRPLPWGAMIAISILGLLYAITVFALFKRRRIAAGAVAMGIGTMLLIAVICTWYLPRADFLRLSPRVADVLIAKGVTQPHQVIMMDYMEPSLAFYQGGTMREAGDVALNERSIPEFKPWMVVSRDIWQRAPANIRDRFDVVADVYGWAYADRGRWRDVLILRRKPSLQDSR